MNFFSKFFNKKEKHVYSYQDFWEWFQKNEKTFYTVIKNRGNIEKVFFDQLSPKLDNIKEGIFFLTGMLDEKTVELIFTPDGDVKNVVFVEELVSAAPKISNWKFVALKQPPDDNQTAINMAGEEFTMDNIFFYSNEDKKHPDEINITVVHNDLNKKNKDIIENGIFIFLDTLIGELNLITKIDHVNVIGKEEAEKELVPIEKLKDFINWRQKEFIEKYDSVRYDTENDTHAIYEAEIDKDKKAVAVINTDLLKWENKTSHPWVTIIAATYEETNDSGMPDEKGVQMLDKIEEELLAKLKDHEGYLNIGRMTGGGARLFYYACKDFRKPTKELYFLQQKYAKKTELNFDIFKDKYWKAFDRYMVY